MRRAEATGHEQHVVAQPFAERPLEVLHAVADDLDADRVEPEANGLRREVGPVAVRSLSADELRARRDDRRGGTAQDVARVILCAVTTNVVPAGSSTVEPFTRTATLSGSASASCSARPWNDLLWPCSSVPL